MKKINTALCSFGMSGLVFHAPFIQAHPGFQLYGVWERSEKKAALKYPGIISFNSYDAMLSDEEIELVIVNTPVYTHFEYAKRALNAGKHILVEKAFTVTAAEAIELTELAQTRNLKICVFQNRRYDSDFKTVKKILESAVLGELKEAEFHYDRFNIELSPKVHKEDGNTGAGLLHDLGPHLVDQALFLFGMPQSLFGSLKITRPGSIVIDYFDILLFYPSFTLRLKAGFIVKEIGASFMLHGTGGSFLKPRADVQEDELKAGKIPGGEEWGLEPAAAKGLLNTTAEGKDWVVSEQGNYMELYDGLYESITNDTAPPVTGEDGINVMKVLEKISESDREKKVIFI